MADPGEIEERQLTMPYTSDSVTAENSSPEGNTLVARGDDKT